MINRRDSVIDHRGSAIDRRVAIKCRGAINGRNAIRDGLFADCSTIDETLQCNPLITAAQLMNSCSAIDHRGSAIRAV